MDAGNELLPFNTQLPPNTQSNIYMSNTLTKKQFNGLLGFSILGIVLPFINWPLCAILRQRCQTLPIWYHINRTISYL